MLVTASFGAPGTMYRALPNRKGSAGLTSRTHEKPQGEDMINLVNCNQRNAVGALEPKWCVARWWRFDVAATSSVVQPGDSVSLTVQMNVNKGELGKPDMPRLRVAEPNPRGKERAWRAEDAGESECHPVTGWTGLPRGRDTRSERTQTSSWSTRERRLGSLPIDMEVRR